MNCEVLQRRLLSSERPDRPSADSAAHLADCAACREWLMRLLQMERALPYLPVPAAEAARSALVRRILAQKTAKSRGTTERRRPSIAMVLGSWIMDPHASPRRRAAAGLVAGVAAALLLFVIGWLVLEGGNNPGPVKVPDKAVDPLVLELRRHKVEVTDTKNPRDRLTAMANAADELRGHVVVRAGGDEELIALATLYTRVLEEGVVKAAAALADEDRREILEPICKNLDMAESAWGRMSSEHAGLSPRVQIALDKAQKAAQTGRDQLRKMYSA